VAGGVLLSGGDRAGVVTVVAEQMNVDLILVEQRDDSSVDIDGCAGDDVAHVGDGDVHDGAVFPLDTQ
jgi:hypothetical protein